MADIYKCCPGGAVVDADELRKTEAAIMCIRCGRFFYGPKTAAERAKRQDIMQLRPGDFVAPQSAGAGQGSDQ